MCRSAIYTFRRSAADRILGILVGDIPGSQWHEAALKLVHPLLQAIDKEYGYGGLRIIGKEYGYGDELQRCLKFCFRLLEEDIDAMGEDQVRSIAILLRWLTRYPFGSSTKHTQGQVDLLVDYHLQICEGTDHKAIDVTFEVLARLGASPSTQGRMRRYIDTMIQYLKITPEALHASWAVRSAIISLGQEDESFRARFAKALSSVRLGQLPDGTIWTKKASTFGSHLTCLKFLCLLSQVPAWHPQLHQSGHFDNCLAIVDVLPSGENNLFGRALAVPVAHILAIMDASGDKNPFFKTVQGYPSWPVILQAWRYIFIPNPPKGSLVKFVGDWHLLSTAECIAALPPLVASARRRCSNSEEPVVIALVEQAFHQLNEERQNHEQDGSQEDKIFVSGESHDLIKEICRLLDAM